MAQLKTSRDWVEEIQTALSNIITGELASYTLAGRTFTQHNIDSLSRLHKYWMGQMESDSHGIVTYSDQRAESYESENSL